METKPLLYGLIGFFIGGLLVSVAATTFDKLQTEPNNEMTMSQMTEELKSKTGDEYDKAFIEHMIAHHEAAVEMAKLSEANARHSEIKQLSRDVVAAQQSEIDQMKSWQRDWRYIPAQNHGGMSH